MSGLDLAKLSLKTKAYLDITDSRTGRTVRVPVQDDGVVDVAALSKALNGGGERAADAPPPLRLLDHGLQHTAICRSGISFATPTTLYYRGYSVEELCQRSNFLEVAYLLIRGELPTKTAFETWCTKIMHHTFIHENLSQLMKTFRYDAHPMGMVIGSLGALGTFYPDANPALQGADAYDDVRLRNTQIYRIIGKLPTIAACAYRHRVGRPYNHPVNHLSYTGNFLYMLDRLTESDYQPDPRLVKALDVMFILNAEMEVNCSTAAMRHVASACADPVTAVAAAASALYGPLCGGGADAALDMLTRIGAPDAVGGFLDAVKAGRETLHGFGHHVFRGADPRSRVLKAIAFEVMDVCGRDPLIDVATALEKRVAADAHFRQHSVFPNMDLYAGLVYKAMGFPRDFMVVLKCIPRAVGWLAHWAEALDDDDTRLTRPTQVYNGASERAYLPPSQRDDAAAGGVVGELAHYSTGTSKRHLTTPTQMLMTTPK